jgi:hypothetical protein
VALLALAVLLAITGTAVFPCWRYSRRWGYVPSAVVGALLLSVALAAIAGRGSVIDKPSERPNQPQRHYTSR